MATINIMPEESILLPCKEIISEGTSFKDCKYKIEVKSGDKSRSDSRNVKVKIQNLYCRNRKRLTFRGC
jgi:hypothetical protein